MQILYLSTWFPYPPDNGSKIRAYYLLRALARCHEVTAVAFCPDGNGNAASASIPGCEHVRLYPVAADPFRYVALPQWRKFLSPVPVSLWPIDEMQQVLASIAATERFDAVVAVQSPVARYGRQFSDAARILDIDTALCYQIRARYLEQTNRAARLRTWTSWQKAQAAEGRLFRRYHACTVVADTEADYLQRMVSPADCQLAIISNGVDCERNRLDLAEKRPYSLVYNGALTYSANYDAMRYFLAEIYPLIRQQQPLTSLIITGSTSGVDLRGLNLNDSVHLSGYVDDIRPLVAGSAVCVVPLREGGGTRLKILEAMALGTPVVSTAKGVEGLDVVDGKDLLLADDPAQFAALTLRLLKDEGLRSRLATNARQLVEEHYDWRAIGQRFVELVEQMVERKKRASRHV